MAGSGQLEDSSSSSKSSDGAVRAARVEYDRAAPPILPLRDGILIDGIYPCRLTVGRLILLQAAQNGIFLDTESKGEDVNVYDVLEAVWMCMDENLDEAIRICEDKKTLRKRVLKFSDGFGKKRLIRVVGDFITWITSISEILCQYVSDDDEFTGPRDWWIECADILASQYAWSESFILWELPIIRAMKYQEAVIARLSGEPRNTGINDQTTALLEAQLAARKREQHGES